MKFGVSKILPNSLSKWLSPKVDGNNGRRRRHEEIESDDSDTSRNASPIISTAQNPLLMNRRNNINYHNAPQSMVPPTKKQKTTSVKFCFNFVIRTPSVFKFVGKAYLYICILCYLNRHLWINIHSAHTHQLLNRYVNVITLYRLR